MNPSAMVIHVTTTKHTNPQTSVANRDDQDLVAALRDPRHPQYDAAWSSVRASILPTLRATGYPQRVPASIDIDDLTQEALEEIRHSLPTFRFESRFSTWSYLIVIRTVHRVSRREHAEKRWHQALPLDHAEAIATAPSATSNPNVVVDGQALFLLIIEILTAAGGERLARIFQLWVNEDLRLADIGRSVGLSEARISILLKQARQTLQAHPEICEWAGVRHQSPYQEQKKQD